MSCRVNLRSLYVWRRNALVWKKLFWPALLGNVAEPLLYLLVLGYGLGRFVGDMQGLPYITFLATGFVCANVMNSASFEALYSAYTRMDPQQTWAGMLAAPLGIDDIVLGEILWAATKALMSAATILLVTLGLGIVHPLDALTLLPLLFVAGLCFAAMALVVTVVSRSYDFFMYYFTLLITPMFLFSGVFFPLSELPVPVQWVANALPLTHLVALVRPWLTGHASLSGIALHLGVMAVYGVSAYFVAVALARKRLIH